MNHPKKQFVLWVLVAGAVGLLGGFFLYQSTPGKNAAQPDIPGFLWPNPKAVSAFSLEDHARRAFNQDNLRGKWTFLFFGYTYCPDVCPVTLSVLADVEKRLSKVDQLGDDTQVVFVSVDPQRDSPERLQQYVEYFSPDFIGVTGDEDRLKGLTGQMGIVYAVTDSGSNGNYLVDHAASVLLTDPEARLVAVFGLPHDADTIANRFVSIRQFIEG